MTCRKKKKARFACGTEMQELRVFHTFMTYEATTSIEHAAFVLDFVRDDHIYFTAVSKWCLFGTETRVSS